MYYTINVFTIKNSLNFCSLINLKVNERKFTKAENDHLFELEKQFL
jgi:hypothetical protein